MDFFGDGLLLAETVFLPDALVGANFFFFIWGFALFFAREDVDFDLAAGMRLPVAGCSPSDELRHQSECDDETDPRIRSMIENGKAIL